MVMAVKHVLESTHGRSVESIINLIVHAIVESFIWIIDIELSKEGRLIRRGKERANAIGKRTMDLENVRATTTTLLKSSAN